MGHSRAGESKLDWCIVSEVINFSSSLSQYRSLLPMYYRNAAAAIIVYDITNEVGACMYGELEEQCKDNRM